jgi:PQQ-like domain
MSGRHAKRTLGWLWVMALLLGSTAGWWVLRPEGKTAVRPSVVSRPASSPTIPATLSPSPSSRPSPDLLPAPGPVDPRHPGLTTFRGNLTRSYYGEGPIPRHPVIEWRYPASGSLCRRSADIAGTRVWCGTGWTGQPNVIPIRKGGVEVREGAYDGNYHFLDGRTGTPVRPDLVTGDLAKGSATSDPNGYPLYYAGSRDGLFRIVALDRPAPTVLWTLNADTSVPNPTWNDDWDGAALIVGDYLLEAGENSWFYVVRLHRGYDSHGKVTVDPKIVMRVPGFDQRLIDAIGDTDVSIEGSVAFAHGVAYFANSGGLVEGWDISKILRGGTKYERVFRFWNGDDTDATIAIDRQGFLYVGRKMEDNVSRPESFPRDHRLGSLMKLDPSKPKHPVVWSVQLGGFEPDQGILGTPAIDRGIVYATYTDGGVAAVDARTGKLLWDRPLPGPTWSSPVPVGGRMLVGDGSGLYCFDILKPRKRPPLMWRLSLGGAVESTPAVWHGWIYVGSRGGAIYGIADENR